MIMGSSKLPRAIAPVFVWDSPTSMGRSAGRLARLPHGWVFESVIFGPDIVDYHLKEGPHAGRHAIHMKSK